MWGWIEPLLRALLPFLFSGEKKTTVKTHEGPGGGLDRKPANPDKGLKPSDLPPLLLCVGLVLCLSGCFGVQKTHTYHLVEPGAVVEVVAGRVAVRAPGSDEVQQKYDPAGQVLLPKSIYREMREAWLKQHAEKKDGE